MICQLEVHLKLQMTVNISNFVCIYIKLSLELLKQSI